MFQPTIAFMHSIIIPCKVCVVPGYYDIGGYNESNIF